jgi:orotidine-5'-phosphate decarboxylase
MHKLSAKEKLNNKNQEFKFVCVGLDVDLEKIPSYLGRDINSIFQFNKKIVEATKDFVAGYKINFAFYEIYGSKGLDLVEKTLSEIPDDVLIIADVKRGDILNTSKMYAKSVYEYFNFDSSTINPYMGIDSVEPFLDYKSKLNFILTLTSNPSSSDFEKLELKSGKKLYQFVIEKILYWNDKFKNCGIVFGATNIEELNDVLVSINDIPLLIPGVGLQGGNFDDVIKILYSNNKSNFLINLSRSILYADSSEKFFEVAKEEVLRLNKKALNLIKN